MTIKKEEGVLHLISRYLVNRTEEIINKKDPHCFFGGYSFHTVFHSSRVPRYLCFFDGARKLHTKRRRQAMLEVGYTEEKK